MSPVSSFAFLAAESCPLIPLSIRNNRLTTFSTVKCDGWETYFHWVLFSITLAAFWRTIDLIDRFLTKIRSAFWANHFFRPSFIVFSLFLLSYHQLLQFRMSLFFYYFNVNTTEAILYQSWNFTLCPQSAQYRACLSVCCKFPHALHVHQKYPSISVDVSTFSGAVGTAFSLASSSSAKSSS